MAEDFEAGDLVIVVDPYSNDDEVTPGPVGLLLAKTDYVYAMDTGGTDSTGDVSLRSEFYGGTRRYVNKSCLRPAPAGARIGPLDQQRPVEDRPATVITRTEQVRYVQLTLTVLEAERVASALVSYEGAEGIGDTIWEALNQ